MKIENCKLQIGGGAVPAAGGLREARVEWLRGQWEQRRKEEMDERRKGRPVTHTLGLWDFEDEGEIAPGIRQARMCGALMWVNTRNQAVIRGAHWSAAELQAVVWAKAATEAENTKDQTPNTNILGQSKQTVTN